MGQALADLIRQRFLGNVVISLVGFSLGCSVIYSCLSELSQDVVNAGYIHNVVLLGGAVSNKNWESALTVPSGTIINAYNTQDYILRYAFRFSQLESPIGFS